MPVTAKNRYVKLMHTMTVIPKFNCVHSHTQKLNHINMCTSYSQTLKVIDAVSKLHSAPLESWIQKGVVLKFWGDMWTPHKRYRIRAQIIKEE